jgi:single-strand DNA-binding protein
VILLGNLTRDPEVSYLRTGTACTTMGLALGRKYKVGEETREEVCYIDVVSYGKQAENCGKCLSKGSGVMVEGRLRQRRWESEDGKKHNKVDVVADAVQFMPKRQPGQSAALEVEEMLDEGDIPF